MRRPYLVHPFGDVSSNFFLRFFFPSTRIETSLRRLKAPSLQIIGIDGVGELHHIFLMTHYT